MDRMSGRVVKLIITSIILGTVILLVSLILPELISQKISEDVGTGVYETAHHVEEEIFEVVDTDLSRNRYKAYYMTAVKSESGEVYVSSSKTLYDMAFGYNEVTLYAAYETKDSNEPEYLIKAEDSIELAMLTIK